MTIFNEVRIAERNPNYGVDGPEWLPPVVSTGLNRLMVRFNTNGHMIVAERTDDDSDFFQFSGWVIGNYDVDEYGIIFDALDSKRGGKVNHVIITRKGVYGE